MDVYVTWDGKICLAKNQSSDLGVVIRLLPNKFRIHPGGKFLDTKNPNLSVRVNSVSDNL
jgi:hypothetical protein